MKYYAYVLIAMCSTLSVFGQTQKLFDVEEITLTDTIEQKRMANLLQEKPVLYEDDKYVVRRTCSGEWGGAVYFKNKITQVERACSATCAVEILKINNKYLVVSSLAHLFGHTSIIEIDNPESLKIYKRVQPTKRKRKIKIGNLGDNESKSLKGTKVLLDTVGIETISAFVYQEQAYYIISGRDGTYISKIESKKFTLLEKITDKNFWSPESTVQNIDGHYNVLFDGNKTKGYIDIADNQIKIIYFK